MLSGELQRSEGTRAMRRTIQRQENGTWHASGEACPWARVIVFGWQDLAILHGAPVARRMFIDGFAARLYPSHLRRCCAIVGFSASVTACCSRGDRRPAGAVG